MLPLVDGAFQQVPGESWGTPKEVWGFRAPEAGPRPIDAARAFLSANAGLFGLADGLRGLRFQKRIESLGAHHVIFQQIHANRRVHRAYVTAHMDRARRVFLAKNRAAPAALLPPDSAFRLDVGSAIDRAIGALPRHRNASAVKVLDTEDMWFPEGKRIHAAWRIRIARQRPAEEWIVYVNARSGGTLSLYDNLSAATGRALVFDPSPVIALDGHEVLLTPGRRVRRVPRNAYRAVSLRGLSGNGFLDGSRVTTRPTDERRRVHSPNHRFELESDAIGFEEVMAYYHIDTAIRYLEALGYRGTRKIFRRPVEVNVNGTREDNSWYSPWLKRLTFGTGAIDDAEDAETILHELGHAIQDAICPDFGQSKEAAAMGEGFGDYFAASFFADRKPERYATTVMAWDGLLIGLEEGSDPPCLRRLDGDLTFDDFRVRGDEHENGRIWSATLWDIRCALGRTLADTLILESHFQLDGFTTFARGARAIIDADANLAAAANAIALRQIFERRRIGPI